LGNPYGRWVGSVQRASPATGDVLEEQQALCRYGTGGSAGFSVVMQLSCVLFEGRVAGGANYPSDARPRGALVTDLDTPTGKLYNVDSDGVLLGVQDGVVDFIVHSIAATTTRLTALFRIGGLDLALNAARMAELSALFAYGSYSSAYWSSGPVVSLSIAPPPSAGQPGVLFLQSPSCSVQAEYLAHFNFRGSLIAHTHGGSTLTAAISCPSASGGHTGFGFFIGPPVFVPNPAGASGMYVFAIIDATPPRFGYGLKP
jgi:hypothetical protein